jgi:hypothetical protein
MFCDKNGKRSDSELRKICPVVLIPFISLKAAEIKNFAASANQMFGGVWASAFQSKITVWMIFEDLDENQPF